MKRNRQLKYQTFETCFEQECMDHKECPKVKTYIKKQKKKKIHSGRPPLNNQQSPNNVVEIKDIQYISESPILGKIMESEIKGEEISKTKKANRWPWMEMDKDYLAKIESQSPIEYFNSELVNEFELLYQEILEDEKNYES